MKYIILACISLYRWVISPLYSPCCRYAPSCSEYAKDAVSYHGVKKGGWLALRRILSCHPWGGQGFDPVPGTMCNQQSDPYESRDS